MVKNVILRKLLALFMVFAMFISLLSIMVISVYDNDNDDVEISVEDAIVASEFGMEGIGLSGDLSSAGIRVDFDTTGGQGGQSPLYRYARIPFEQGGVPVPGSYIIGAIYMPSPPTKTHFVFRHWSLTPICTNLESDIFTEDCEVFEPITVYAQWGHSIVFDGNGVTLGNLDVDPIYDYSYASRIVSANGTVNETMGMVWPIDPQRPRQGNTFFGFDGWYDTREQTGGNRFDGDTPIGSNVILFARWVEVLPEPVIEITFDFQGGELVNQNDSNMRQFVAGFTLSTSNSMRPDINTHFLTSRSSAPNIRNGNFSWGGWWTAPGGPYGGGTQVGSASSSNTTSLQNTFTPTTSMMLYAYWEIVITIDPTCQETWLIPPGIEWPGWEITHPNWGPFIGPHTFRFPSTHPLPITWSDIPLGFPTNPTAPNRTFVGWATRTGGWSVPPTPVTYDTVFNENTTVFALWEIERHLLAINFDANGGTFPNGNDLHVAEMLTSLPTINFQMWVAGYGGYCQWPHPPERPGYIFMGWGVSPGDTNFLTWNVYGTTSFDVIADNGITYYARWTSDYIALTFHPRDGINNNQSEIIRIPRGWTFHNMSWGVSQIFCLWYEQHWIALPWWSSRHGGGFNSQPDGWGRVFMSDATRLQDEEYYLITEFVQIQFDRNHRSVIPTITDWQFASDFRTLNLPIGVSYNDSRYHPHVIINTNLSRNWPTTLTWGNNRFPFPLDGHGFLGWNTRQDGEGEWITRDSEITENIRVYAIWIEGVTFQPGLAPDHVIEEENRVRRPVFPGSIDTAPENMVPPPNEWYGHVFRGWNTSPDRHGATVDGSTPLNAGVTLYATWDSEMTFDANAPAEDNPIISGSSVASIPVGRTVGGYFPTSVTRDNWRHRTNNSSWLSPMWNSRSDGTGINFTSTSPFIPRSMTLYAQWEADVTFDGNGGSWLLWNGGTTTIQIRTLSENSMLPFSNMPANPTHDTNSEYEFYRWRWQDGDGDWHTFNQSTFTMTSGHITLVAEYRIRPISDYIFQIWNWEDLAYINVLIAEDRLDDYEKFLVMQHIGTNNSNSGFDEVRGWGHVGYQTVAGGWTADGWTPIGSSGAPFVGHFDGNEKMISGLWINRPAVVFANTEQGLFGRVGGSGDVIIERFVLHLADSLTPNANGAGIIGASAIGGLIGRIEGNTIVSQVAVNGHIRATGNPDIGGGGGNGSNVGGIAGHITNWGTVAIRNSYTSGSIEAATHVAGGIAGFAGSAVFENVFTAANVRAGGPFPGGTMGRPGPIFSMGGAFPAPVIVGGWTDRTIFDNANVLHATNTTAASMTQSSLPNTFDFDNIWAIEEGATYPFFQWQLTMGKSNNHRLASAEYRFQGSGGEFSEWIRMDRLYDYQLTAPAGVVEFRVTNSGAARVYNAYAYGAASPFASSTFTITTMVDNQIVSIGGMSQSGIIGYLLEGGASISGRVFYDGWNPGNRRPAIIRLYDSSNTAVATLNTYRDEYNGAWEFTNVPAGTYRIVAHKMNHTRFTIFNITVTDVDIVIQDTLFLFAGNMDAINDDIINTLDWTLLENSMFRTHVEDLAQDLNDDGFINVLDQVLLLNNFLQTSRMIDWTTLP